MVLLYGGSSAKHGLPPADKAETFKRILFLADTVWKAIADIVCRPRECMAWLQQLASLCNEANIPIRWITPLGFPVEQAYKAEDMVRIKTTLGDTCRPVSRDPDTLLGSPAYEFTDPETSEGSGRCFVCHGFNAEECSLLQMAGANVRMGGPDSPVYGEQVND